MGRILGNGTSIETSIFHWEDWDSLSVSSFIFYAAEFKKDFGPWKAGQKVHHICIDFDNGVMYDENDTKCRIGLCVVE